MSKGFLPVAEALGRVLAPVRRLDEEFVTLREARGRTLARDLAALRTQPPTDVSAMDGYAIRFADLDDLSKPLKLIGESAAGRRHAASLKTGETVRIFTGAPVPQGADTVLIQEMAKADGDMIHAKERPAKGRNIRKAGLDFAEGDALLKAGTPLGAAELALAAAMNHANVPVVHKPLVAIIATGDELVAPGFEIGPDQIVASNTYAISALAEEAGATVLDLGIVVDRLDALASLIHMARESAADVLVTLGGASVGDHDVVKQALADEGMTLDFWRIAMRPGKPLIHGRLGDMSILGLPGNPVSSLVCGLLFLVPLIRALLGDPNANADRSEAAVLGAALPANDQRQDYLRASLEKRSGQLPIATPGTMQDSSMLRVMAEAECLLIRGPNATADGPGAPCRILRLRPAW